MSNNTRELRYTLVSEGSSDIALMPILKWLLQENGVRQAIQGEWADLGEAQVIERISLTVKIREAVRLYPCDLLFVHRDADRATREGRLEEIDIAISKIIDFTLPAICVIPVRMQETWLLFDEKAIRFAAGNRNGRIPLNLPLLAQLESLPDPKKELHDCLKRASGLNKRRLKSFHTSQRARRVSEFCDDFSPLRNLQAFKALEHDIRQIIGRYKWKN
jgi:hypothetical protein